MSDLTNAKVMMVSEHSAFPLPHVQNGNPQDKLIEMDYPGNHDIEMTDIDGDGGLDVIHDKYHYYTASSISDAQFCDYYNCEGTSVKPTRVSESDFQLLARHYSTDYFRFQMARKSILNRFMADLESAENFGRNITGELGHIVDGFNYPISFIATTVEDAEYNLEQYNSLKDKASYDRINSFLNGEHRFSEIMIHARGYQGDSDTDIVMCNNRNIAVTVSDPAVVARIVEKLKPIYAAMIETAE